jgi:hypothetical protein
VREALKAYLWWVLGIASAVALAWAYHRRLTAQLAPAGQESPPAPPPGGDSESSGEEV